MSNDAIFNKAVLINDAKYYIEDHLKMSSEQLKRNSNSRFSIMCLSGPPGIGKSDVIEQICYNNNWGLCVYYMATMMLEQLTGLPKASSASQKCFFNWLSDSIKVLKNDKVDIPLPISNLINKLPEYKIEKEPPYTVWSLPEIFSFRNIKYLPDGFNFDSDTMVLFLDDIHLVSKTMQSYLFQLLTYRSINSHKLPQNVILLTAGNRSNDKAGFQQMLAPITNRMYFLDVTSDVDDWTKHFAGKYGVRTDVIMFLQNNETAFLSQPLENHPWASPRSWTYASDSLTSTELNRTQELKNHEIFNIIRGHVGDEYASKFLEYKTVMLKFPGKDIIDGNYKPDYDSLNQMDLYALQTVSIDELMKRIKLKWKAATKNEIKFKLDKQDKENIDNLKNVLENVVEKCKQIVPIGIKVMLAIEQSMNKDIDIAKQLLTTSEKLKKISAIL